MTSVHEQFRHFVNHSNVSVFADKTILVIEDSVSMAALLSTKLIYRWDCKVVVANSYSAAKKLLGEDISRFYLAISDLDLPDAPNGEIVDLLTANGLQTIVMTGVFGEETREATIQKGAIDYIIKDSANAYDYAIELAGRLLLNTLVKILVVDDSVSIRSVLAHVLSLQNFQVLSALDGKEALVILDKNPDISIVITDYNMPDMDGHELTIAVRRQFDKSQLVIIGISSVDTYDLGVQFLKCGANDFLHKPFSHEELICRINLNLDNLRYIATVEHLANHDHLTKLYNRRCFFTQGMALFNHEAQIIQVAMLDIDHFKKVNDTMGHECGDKVLVEFAQLLQQHFASEIVGRIGGEEFAIIFSQHSNKQAIDKLSGFLEALRALNIVYDNHTLSVTASIGCECHQHTNIDEALKAADEKMYAAKNNGRNRLVS